MVEHREIETVRCGADAGSDAAGAVPEILQPSRSNDRPSTEPAGPELPGDINVDEGTLGACRLEGHHRQRHGSAHTVSKRRGRRSADDFAGHQNRLATDRHGPAIQQNTDNPVPDARISLT